MYPSIVPFRQGTFSCTWWSLYLGQVVLLYIMSNILLPKGFPMCVNKVRSSWKSTAIDISWKNRDWVASYVEKAQELRLRVLPLLVAANWGNTSATLPGWKCWFLSFTKQKHCQTRMPNRHSTLGFFIYCPKLHTELTFLYLRYSPYALNHNATTTTFVIH